MAGSTRIDEPVENRRVLAGDIERAQNFKVESENMLTNNSQLLDLKNTINELTKRLEALENSAPISVSRFNDLEPGPFICEDMLFLKTTSGRAYGIEDGAEIYFSEEDECLPAVIESIQSDHQVGS